jgi:hypothetical protein
LYKGAEIGALPCPGLMILEGVDIGEGIDAASHVYYFVK